MGAENDGDGRADYRCLWFMVLPFIQDYMAGSWYDDGTGWKLAGPLVGSVCHLAPAYLKIQYVP